MSAKRFNQGKTQWSLVDFPSLEGAVRVLEIGKEKYGAFNWKKGLYTTKISESLMRHLFAYLDGEDIDEDGLRHIDHIICNSMFLSYMDNKKPEFDDRESLQSNKKTKLSLKAIIKKFLKGVKK